MPPRDVVERDRRKPEPDIGAGPRNNVNSIRSGFIPDLDNRRALPPDREESRRQQRLVGQAIAGVLLVVAPPVGLAMAGVLELQGRGVLPEASGRRRGPTGGRDNGERPEDTFGVLGPRLAGPAGAAPAPAAPAGAAAGLEARAARRAPVIGVVPPTRKRRLLGV